MTTEPVPAPEQKPEATPHHKRNLPWGGLILIVLGIVFLLQQAGIATPRTRTMEGEGPARDYVADAGRSGSEAVGSSCRMTPRAVSFPGSTLKTVCQVASASA